jgi:hypothetical protein
LSQPEAQAQRQAPFRSPQGRDHAEAAGARGEERGGFWHVTGSHQLDVKKFGVLINRRGG